MLLTSSKLAADPEALGTIVLSDAAASVEIDSGNSVGWSIELKVSVAEVDSLKNPVNDDEVRNTDDEMGSELLVKVLMEDPLDSVDWE